MAAVVDLEIDAFEENMFDEVPAADSTEADNATLQTQAPEGDRRFNAICLLGVDNMSVRQRISSAVPNFNVLVDGRRDELRCKSQYRQGAADAGMDR